MTDEFVKIEFRAPHSNSHRKMFKRDTRCKKLAGTTVYQVFKALSLQSAVVLYSKAVSNRNRLYGGSQSISKSHRGIDRAVSVNFYFRTRNRPSSQCLDFYFGTRNRPSRVIRMSTLLPPAYTYICTVHCTSLKMQLFFNSTGMLTKPEPICVFLWHFSFFFLVGTVHVAQCKVNYKKYQHV